MRQDFKVSLEIPGNMTVPEMVQYIHGVVSDMAKCSDPDLPLFDLDRNSVEVSATFAFIEDGSEITTLMKTEEI